MSISVRNRTYADHPIQWRRTVFDPDGANYRRLETPTEDVQILVQAVAHPGRVHSEIETDDIEAQVVRLERLRARRVAQITR